MNKNNRTMPKDEVTLRGVLVAVIKETIPQLSTLREKEWAMATIEYLTDTNKLRGEKRMIKNSGIVRRVDELGRVVIPKELRQSIGIDYGTPLEFSLDDANGWVVLEAYSKACHFCGSKEDVNAFKEKQICERCMNELYNS